jgi:hypothetical protein
MNKSPSITSALLKQDARESPFLEGLPQPLTNEGHSGEAMFTDYLSPFNSYPLLRGRLPTTSDSSSPPHMRPYTWSSFPSDSSTRTAVIQPSFSAFIPDLQLLREAAISRRLDPSKRLCQYEVPGGGTCRDEKCEDLHLSRLGDVNQQTIVEPSGAWCVRCLA